MKSKKIYLVKADDWSYDDYDSVVVLADSKDEAIKLVETEDSELGQGYFASSQEPLTVKEIVMAGESRVLLGSFNAG